MEIVETFKVTLEYNVAVDTETGELSTNLVKKSIDKTGIKSAEVKEKKPRVSKVKDNSTEPKLILEENKCQLNQAAITLIGVEPGDKLDINYKKIGKELIPIIYKDEKKGNKVNKNLTLACRGSKNEELSKYGTEFNIVAHTDGQVFILKNKDSELEELIEEDEIPIDDSIDVDIEDLLNDEDAQITEISSTDLTL